MLHAYLVPVCWLCLTAIVACQPASRKDLVSGSPRGDVAALQLVESWPLETSLDDPSVADATDVWVAMISAATKTLDVEQFYAVSSDSHPGMERVLAAIEQAVSRGVVVRIIVDKSFYKRMPEVPDRLGRIKGVQLRHLDLRALTGGVQHAKFFIVDGRDAFIGSQNFDWRSLAHIVELGVRVRLPAAVDALAAVFETDWRLAGGMPIAQARGSYAGAGKPIHTRYGGAPATVSVVLSPKPLLLDGAAWNLAHLLAAIDGATRRIRVQLLSYSTRNYDKTTFVKLDAALERAAERGVSVQLMVADWNAKKGRIEALKRLQELSNVTVKMVTIPAHSSGFIPYARVTHSKLMTVDGRWSWLGTSNWSGGYFTQSRNVGLVVESRPFARDLDRHFERLWGQPYAEVVRPEREYVPPRRR